MKRSRLYRALCLCLALALLASLLAACGQSQAETDAAPPWSAFELSAEAIAAFALDDRLPGECLTAAIERGGNILLAYGLAEPVEGKDRFTFVELFSGTPLFRFDGQDNGEFPRYYRYRSGSAIGFEPLDPVMEGPVTLLQVDNFGVDGNYFSRDASPYEHGVATLRDAGDRYFNLIPAELRLVTAASDADIVWGQTPYELLFPGDSPAEDEAPDAAATVFLSDEALDAALSGELLAANVYIAAWPFVLYGYAEPKMDHPGRYSFVELFTGTPLFTYEAAEDGSPRYDAYTRIPSFTPLVSCLAAASLYGIDIWTTDQSHIKDAPQTDRPDELHCVRDALERYLAAIPEEYRFIFIGPDGSCRLQSAEELIARADTAASAVWYPPDDPAEIYPFFGQYDLDRYRVIFCEAPDGTISVRFTLFDWSETGWVNLYDLSTGRLLLSVDGEGQNVDEHLSDCSPARRAYANPYFDGKALTVMHLKKLWTLCSERPDYSRSRGAWREMWPANTLSSDVFHTPEEMVIYSVRLIPGEWQISTQTLFPPSGGRAQDSSTPTERENLNEPIKLAYDSTVLSDEEYQAAFEALNILDPDEELGTGTFFTTGFFIGRKPYVMYGVVRPDQKDGWYVFADRFSGKTLFRYRAHGKSFESYDENDMDQAQLLCRLKAEMEGIHPLFQSEDVRLCYVSVGGFGAVNFISSLGYDIYGYDSPDHDAKVAFAGNLIPSSSEEIWSTAKAAYSYLNLVPRPMWITAADLDAAAAAG